MVKFFHLEFVNEMNCLNLNYMFASPRKDDKIGAMSKDQPIQPDKPNIKELVPSKIK